MGLFYFTHRQFPVGRAGSSEGIPAGDSSPGHLDYKGSQSYGLRAFFISPTVSSRLGVLVLPKESLRGTLVQGT